MAEPEKKNPAADTAITIGGAATAITSGSSSGITMGGATVPGTAAESLVNLAAILEPGTVLGGRYEILEMLGIGGMGAVYKAKDRELDRLIALKVIRPDLARNAEILQRFKQELLLARQVTHKNVIRIFDLGEADGIKFITMEFIVGQDLKHYLAEHGKLTPEEATAVMQQVVAGLAAAHAEGVIHRDLKPGNIMRDAQGRVILMDFGLARAIAGDGMTQTGAMLGTIEYMSPEQAKAEKLDARSDLFTVGLIFYELLTGKTPYRADSALASLLKRTQEAAIPAVQADPSIPLPLSNLVSRCLERDPENRYQDADELLADINNWQGKRAGAALHFPSLGTWGRDIPWQWLTVGLAVLVLAIIGFVFRDKLRPAAKAPAPSAPAVSLAILPFRNASGDPAINWLGTTLAEMLRTDVGQSASLRTVSSERVNSILHDLRISPDSNLDPETIHRVAEFTSADRILWGQYLKLGDQIRIDATLQDLKQQRNFTLKAEASSEKDLPNTLQQLAESVEQNLALTPSNIKELRTKIVKPSSQSVQALRHYGEGLELARQGKNLDAVKELEAAIKEDPNFALAYSKLAATYAVLGYGDKAQELSRKAVDLSDQASPQERYVIQAENARATKDYGHAIDAYENLAKILPEDTDVQYSLARLYEDSGSFDKAGADYEKLLARDPKNIDALLRIGWVEMKRNNARGSLDYLNRALALAVQLGNDEEKANILDAIGNAYRYLNKLDDALRSLQDSMVIKRRLGDNGAIADTLNWIGQIQYFAGKSDEAMKTFQETLRLRREIGDKKGVGEILYSLANLLDDRGQEDQAISMAKEALPLLREVGARLDEANCVSNIGWYYMKKTDYDTAMTYLQQGLQLREKLGVPGDIADSFNSIAETYARSGQYSDAVNNYLKALEQSRKVGDKREVALASWGLGKVFQYQGRYAAAVTSEEDALNNWRDTDDKGYILSEIQASYGNALTLIGRPDQAQKNLDEALSRAHQMKNNALIAEIVNFQGDVLFYRGEYRAAKRFFDQALQTAMRDKSREQILVSRINGAKVEIREGHFRESLNALQALSQEAERSGLKYFSVECSLYIGEAFMAGKDYPRARQALDRALANSDRLGLQALLARSYYLLGEVLRLSGNQAEASRHYANAHRILDDIRKEAHSDDVLKRSDLAVAYQESVRWLTPKR